MMKIALLFLGVAALCASGFYAQRQSTLDDLCAVSEIYCQK